MLDCISCLCSISSQHIVNPIILIQIISDILKANKKPTTWQQVPFWKWMDKTYAISCYIESWETLRPEEISEISQKEPSVALENELSSLSTHRSTRIKPNHQSLQALRSFQVASGVLQSSVSRVMWTETMSQPPTLGWQTKDTEDFAQIYPKRPTKGSNKTCHILGSATVQDVATSELWRQDISTEGVRNFAFMHLNLSHGKKRSSA